MCSRGRDHRFRIMLPRLDRLSLRPAPKPTDAPKRKSVDEINQLPLAGGSAQRPRTNNEGGGSSSGAGGSSSGAGGAPTPDLGGLSLGDLQLEIGKLWSRISAAKREGLPADEIEAMYQELRRLRRAEQTMIDTPPPPPVPTPAEEEQVSEAHALELLNRYFNSGSVVPTHDEWACRWCGWKGRPDVQPDEDGIDTEYCRQCKERGNVYASEDQQPWLGGEDMAGAAAAKRREIDQDEEVARRQNALIELKHVFPEWSKSQLANPLPADVRLLRLANLRVSQAMIWLRLLSDSNEDAKKLLGIALSANEIAVARDLLRRAVIAMVRSGGWPDKNDSTRLRGSALFWAIAMAREILARREKDPFAFYEPRDPLGRRTRTHDYSMQGIADFLEWYLKQAMMLADESQVAATRVGRKYKRAQQKTEQGKYRRPQWYGLGSTELRKQHKLDYLNDLLTAAEMGALQPSTMNFTSTPTVLVVPETENERRRRLRQEAEAAAAAAAAAEEEAAAAEEEAEADDVEWDGEEEEEPVPGPAPQEEEREWGGEWGGEEEEEPVPGMEEAVPGMQGEEEAVPGMEEAVPGMEEGEAEDDDESIWEDAEMEEGEEEGESEDESEDEREYVYEYEYE